MFNKLTLSLLLILSFCGVPKAIGQVKLKLDSAWWFCKGDLGGVWEAIRIPQAGQPTNFPVWQKVTLPHCYNATDAVDPNHCYYQGPAWYRSIREIKNPYKNGRTLLHFEGSGQKTTVYVGRIKAGNHTGGYDEWNVDITDAVNNSLSDTYIQANDYGKIPISIRCDNSRDLEMIPSNLSDFHLYGGLYRNVWLVYQPANLIASLKTNARLASDKKTGTIDVSFQPKGDYPPVMLLSLETDQGKLVYQHSFSYASGKLSFTVPKPETWSPLAPHLYTLKIQAIYGDYIQNIKTQIGFRNFEFKEHGPFYLNGERLLLKGTHRHEDFAGTGAAETEEMVLKEMFLIKKMGANFIRLGHYQQSERVLDLCDSLGLLVWEEIPWCRGGLGGELYKSQARQMLTNMIEQHVNHPSVILWGLGNENDWPGDFQNFEKDSIRAFMSELNALAHQLDPSRMTTIRRCEFCKDIPDVYSPSIWPGWYRGKFTDYERVTRYEMMHTKRFLHVEWGADSHPGRFTEDIDTSWRASLKSTSVNDTLPLSKLYSQGKNMSKEGDWSESYAVDLYDWTLSRQQQMPWLSGTAFWTFKDFATPIRPENPIPAVNQKGITERDLTPKETYYVVQSYWGTEPMVHIFGHSWPVRWGHENEPKLIKVFSNCDQVELFVNGKSGGIRKRNPNTFPASGFTWKLPLHEGENTIKAVGLYKNQTLTDEIIWNYQSGNWTTPVKIGLQEKSIDSGTSYLMATALDNQGKVCLDAHFRVEFGVTGDARLNELQGTSTGSAIIELANGQAKIKLIKTGNTYQASVKADGVGTFLLH